MSKVEHNGVHVNRFRAVPDDLRAHPRWILWRLEGEPGEETKVPVDTRGRKADPHKKWFSFDEAVEALEEADADGIGIVLYEGCGLLAIDLDKISRWEKEALGILDQLSPYGYSELSPSGNGYHIILRPREVPPEHRVKHRDFHGGRVEVYTKLRFLTVTGDDAEGCLSDMTRQGQKELTEFVRPLVRLATDESSGEESGEPSVYEDAEEDMPDEDVIFELMADAAKGKHTGAKAFKEIYSHEDAFDEVEDQSDLLVSAVGAVLRYSMNREQVTRIMESCAAAPYYVDKKTKKPKLSRWLKSELPKLLKSERRSREQAAEAVAQATEEGFLDQYILHKPTGTFFDTNSGQFVPKHGLDMAHRHAFPGVRGTPLISTVLVSSPDLIVVDERTWHPIPWREGDQKYAAPMGQDAVLERGGVRCVNTWRGYALEPRRGDVSPWLDFIKMVVPDKRLHEHIVDRIAFDVQFPDKKCGWHIVIVGTHGAGKDMMLMPLMRIFGPAVGKISDMAAKSGYEDEYVDKKVIHYEEASHLKGSAYERMKSFTTAAPDVPMFLNKKGQGKVLTYPLWSFYLTTNHEDALKLEATERRWLVVRARDRRMPYEESKGFVDWLNTGGAEAVFDFLLRRDLTHFNPDTIETEANALKDMVEASAEPWENALEAYFTTDAGEELMKSGLINYHTLFNTVRREEGVFMTQHDVKLWVQRNLGWQQVRHIGTARAGSRKGRLPLTYMAPQESDLHHLKGVELIDEIQRRTGAAGDFHAHSSRR